MPRYSAQVTLHLDEFYAPDDGASNEFVDAFITKLAQASEQMIVEVTWGEVDYDITRY